MYTVKYGYNGGGWSDKLQAGIRTFFTKFEMHHWLLIHAQRIQDFTLISIVRFEFRGTHYQILDSKKYKCID